MLADKLNTLPLRARLYITTVCLAGLVVAAWALVGLPRSIDMVVQTLLFGALATIADLKRVRLKSANYSVATALNFACALVIGPEAATLAAASGSCVGDIAGRKPLHKIAFNASTLALSVATGGAALAALRSSTAGPVPADAPAFVAYTIVNAVVNMLLVGGVIALVTKTSIVRVVVGNYKTVGAHFAVLWPLGLLMAVVYSAFGGWIGLSLLVLPVIAAYSALNNARQLREAHSVLNATHAELSRTHEELRDTHEQLKASQAQVVEQERLRALGQMASGIAHDFNNALSPVVGFSELLLAQPAVWTDERFMRQYLGLIHTSAQDAAKVVRKLREFYRKPDELDALLPLDLNRLVSQSVDITQPRWRDQAQAAGAMIKVTTELADLPPVAGDESAIRELLTNLIFNAVDAMPRGGTIHLRTRVAGAQVALEVVDTGTGMSEEVRRRCLDPFFTTKGTGGTGMGLSMTLGIVQRHGGTLEIDSAWGQGTTMRILLPGCATQQAAEAAPDGATLAIAPTDASAPARRMRVLVVDDEPTVRTVVTAYLTSYGYEYTLATNGYEGLLRFREGTFDAVITDRAMPDMNGDDLARAIKDSSPNTPVIMLTGFGDMMTVLGTVPPQVDEVLAKPVRHTTLREALDRLVPDPAPAPIPSSPAAPAPSQAVGSTEAAGSAPVEVSA